MLRNFARTATANKNFLAPKGVRFFAADKKAILLRMRTVENVGKITAAMKMVAAAKLKGVEEAMRSGRPYAERMQGIIGDIPNGDSSEGNRHLEILVTSDKGLCGGVNSAIVKVARNKVKADDGMGIEQKLFVIGQKAIDGLGAQKLMFEGTVNDCSKNPPTFALASMIAEELADVEYDIGRIHYNVYQSVIAYETTCTEVISRKRYMDNMNELMGTYEFELDHENTIKDMCEFNLASTIYSCMNESAASEMSARMSAMDNATKNAGEMLDALTLLYNRARQAAITTELIEIVSGAESLKG